MIAFMRGRICLAISRFSSSGTAEPSHMCDWKIGLRPALTSLLGGGDEREHEVVERVLRAVVGVQRDGDRVVLRDLVGEARERERARGAGLDGVAGEVVGAAGGDLDDAVGPRLGEPLQHRVERLRGGDVERREGEAVRPWRCRASRRTARGLRWAWCSFEVTSGLPPSLARWRGVLTVAGCREPSDARQDGRHAHRLRPSPNSASHACSSLATRRSPPLAAAPLVGAGDGDAVDARPCARCARRSPVCRSTAGRGRRGREGCRADAAPRRAVRHAERARRSTSRSTRSTARASRRRACRARWPSSRSRRAARSLDIGPAHYMEKLVRRVAAGCELDAPARGHVGAHRRGAGRRRVRRCGSRCRSGRGTTASSARAPRGRGIRRALRARRRRAVPARRAGRVAISTSSWGSAARPRAC